MHTVNFVTNYLAHVGIEHKPCLHVHHREPPPLQVSKSGILTPRSYAIWDMWRDNLSMSRACVIVASSHFYAVFVEKPSYPAHGR